MAKLTKLQIKAHREALALLEKDALTLDEREFVLNNWQESANHINSAAGAFFTPLGLAFDFTIELGGSWLKKPGARIIDLCAGIGALSFAARCRLGLSVEIVCVEINPDYAAVGRKVVPDATWIVGDVFNLPSLGRFDVAISNPPFGRIKGVNPPRYKGGEFDLGVVDVASDLAPYGVFILPNMSLPFVYSGQPHYRERESAKYDRFREQTGIELTMNCGIDCDYFRDLWRGAAPAVEIALADFTEVQAARQPAQADMFAEAA